MTPDEASKKSKGMTLRQRVFFMLLLFGPGIYFKTQGDYVTGVTFTAAGLAAFSGYRAGALSILALFAGMSAAIALAPSLGTAQEWRLADWFGTTGLTNRFLSIGAVGLLIIVTLSIVTMCLSRRIVRNRPKLVELNRWSGFAIGAVEGVAVIFFCLGGILAIEPVEKERAPHRDPSDSRGQMISKVILKTCEQTRASRIGPAIVALNPFVHLPQLNKVEQIQQSVSVLSDPVQIQGLMQHPSIRELQQRSDVKRVVEKLQADPEIQEVLYSGRKMDRSMAMILMNHPAVMELIDQPGFVDAAAKVIQSTNLFPASR